MEEREEREPPVQVLLDDDAITSSTVRAALEERGFPVIAVSQRKAGQQTKRSDWFMDAAEERQQSAQLEVSAATDETYEGTVRLAVQPPHSMQKFVRFVDRLRGNSQFRLLRLEACQPQEEVSIWLALREPTKLVEVLLKIDDVANVTHPSRTTSDDKEWVLEVILE